MFITNCDSTGGKNSTVQLKSYPCLLQANPQHHDALKILNNFFADIEARRKVEKDLFGEWVRMLDFSFRAQDGKVLL